MGYDGFSREFFSSRFLPDDAKLATTGACDLGLRKRRIIHGASIDRISDFLQGIAVLSRRPSSSSPRGEGGPSGRMRRPRQPPGVPVARPAAANQCGRRRSSQSSDAIAEAPQRRDVVGQQHEAERQHPEAENRQDGEAAADDQQDAGGNARPARGGLSEPAGHRLHPARQPAEEPPQPPFRIGVGDSRRKRSWIACASARDRQPRPSPQSVVFPMPRPLARRQARSIALAAASSASTIAWICSGVAARPRRRS